MTLPLPLGADNGSALQVVTLDLEGVTVSRQVWAMGGYLLGWSITEDTGAATASVRLAGGGGPVGELISKINLTAGQINLVRPGVGGWPIPNGLYLAVDSGAVSGSLVIGKVL